VTDLATIDVVDLFGGPGGWDVAAARLGLRPVGIEWNAAACATRAAAGHLTIRASVADYPPEALARRGPVRGLIASPPCPAFSRAGRGKGYQHVAALVAAVEAGDWSARPDPDPLVWLCLEPGRWIDALHPEWIAMEQVPSVLPLWEAYARRLRAAGYSVWCGVLSAEQYGVPQVRKRAVLIASRVRQVDRPEPTHTAYRKGDEQPSQHSLFAEPLLPAVTMGQALGWDGVVGFPRRDDMGTSPDGYRERDWRGTDAPAATVTEKARSWVLNPGMAGWTKANRRVYPLDQPAPTLVFGHDAASWRWELAPCPCGGDGAVDGVGNALHAETCEWFLADWHDRRNDQSNSGEVDPEWPIHRPATTIAGRGLVTDPGANANRFNGHQKSRNDGYRVQAVEAAVLQSFPPGYPWQGTRTQQFQQIGNAVPPGLAHAILSTLTDPQDPTDG
jgi:DNA (cytosine-5)-methyltransferase 1